MTVGVRSSYDGGYLGVTLTGTFDDIAPFGTLADDNFDIDGTTYTVWRVAVDTEQKLHFDVATGATQYGPRCRMRMWTS